MLKINFYPLDYVENEKLKYAIIAARYKDKWVFVRNKKRSTWELPAGHRENEENILNTASRELYEETGAQKFDIHPLYIYSVTDKKQETFGQLFYALIYTLGDLPDMEIGEVKLWESLPDNLTYPFIQPTLLKKVIDHCKI